jgi:hypothetical protein
MQYVHAVWTYNMDMQHGHGHACMDIDMQNGYGHAALISTYSRDMDIDMKIDTDVDIDMETKNWKHLCLATYFFGSLTKCRSKKHSQ